VVLVESFSEENGIKSIIIQQDDYFVYPPKTNAKMREKKISHVGLSEVRLELLNQNLRDILKGKDEIDVDSLNKAILAVKYFEYGTRKIFSDYEQSPQKIEENRILEYLIKKSKAADKINVRDIYRELHRDSKDCHRILESLEQIGEIQMIKEGKSYYVKL